MKMHLRERERECNIGEASGTYQPAGKRTDAGDGWGRLTVAALDDAEEAKSTEELGKFQEAFNRVSL